MNTEQIKIYINNNPKCNAKLYSAVKNEEWQMENKPFIKIYGSAFDDEDTKVIVRINNEKIYENSIHPEHNKFEFRVDLDELIEDESVISVDINENIFNFAPKFIKVSGTIKYSNGSPVENPVINFTSKDVAILGDENGNYEMILSDKEEQIGIFDKEYSVNTLEVWLRNFDLYDNRNIDFIIDKLELYRMNMWSGERSDYIHFIPMSVTRAKKVMSKGYTTELEIIKDPEVWPKLERKDVKVFIEDEEIKILSFTEVSDYLLEDDEKSYGRPSYVLSIPKITKSKLVKIEIESEVDYQNETVMEYGQGYYFW